MKINEAIRILQKHNRWRRGNDDLLMQSPTLIGEAIDIVISEVKRLKQFEPEKPCTHEKTYYCLRTGGSRCRKCKSLL